MSFWYEKEAKRLLQKLPFYNVLIETPCIKRIKNIDLLRELPCYDELNIKEISKAFKRYARSYKVEIISPKDPLIQLEFSKQALKTCLKTL